MTVEQNALTSFKSRTTLVPCRANTIGPGLFLQADYAIGGADGTLGRGMQWQGMSLWMTLRYGKTPWITSSYIPTLAGSGEEMVGAKAEDFYTCPDEAKAFCEETGIDALAIAFGTAHGFYSAQPKLDFDVVKNCAKATGLPLVMHGGSGVSDEGFKSAIANGIRKINYYSYMSKAGYMAAKEAIESGKMSYLHDVEYAAMQAMKEDVKKAIKVFSLSR